MEITPERQATTKRMNEYLRLPCGCNINQVSTWLEAMNHILIPKNCPNSTNKE